MLCLCYATYHIQVFFQGVSLGLPGSFLLTWVNSNSSLDEYRCINEDGGCCATKKYDSNQTFVQLLHIYTNNTRTNQIDNLRFTMGTMHAEESSSWKLKA